MGLFSSKNPADAAMEYTNQIPGVAQENLGPWAQQGQQAQMQNQGQYNQMVSSPGEFYEQLRSQYSPSRGYQVKQDRMMKALEGKAAAGGRVGTTANDAARLQLTQDLLSEDENNYIDRLLGIHSTGLQGNEFASNRGFGAAGDIANINATNLSQQGSLAYNKQQNENERNNAWLSALFGLGGAALGGIAGGPAGAGAGYSIGSSLAGGGSKNSAPSNAMQFGQGIGRGSPTWGGNY